MIDAKTFGEELAGIVKAQLSPVVARLDALERSIAEPPPPVSGKGTDPEDVAVLVLDRIKGEMGALRADMEARPVGLTEAQVREMVEAVETRVGERSDEAVQAAVKALPPAKDGQPGKSVTLDDVTPLVQDAVSKAVAAIPPAAPGKDGVGLAGALIDREGQLVITLTNGEAKALGPVVGKDAEPAEPGRDGLGFEDMDFEERDGRLHVVFRRGEVVKEARLPSISYRGVWKAAQYLTGDSVTFGACQWIATQDTDEKPGEGKAWQLAVRKGRDGKDGVPKAERRPEPVKVGGGNAG